MMNKIATCLLGLFCGFFVLPVAGESDHHSHGNEGHHQGMEMDRDGMVMNANDSNLPKDCEEISEDVAFQVGVGRNHAATGYTFGYDQHEYRVPRCSRVTITFTNEDEVRHQWMVHGLPRYLYPQGMFHLEVNGGKTRSGTFIVPSDAKTYLVHCDMAQHMEKGLKAQLVVGLSKDVLPNIPGVSRATERDTY